MKPEELSPEKLQVRDAETFSRKVEAARALFREDLGQLQGKTSGEALKCRMRFNHSSECEEELSIMLWNWLTGYSLDSIERWFWAFHENAVSSPDGPRQSSADWVAGSVRELVFDFFNFEMSRNPDVNPILAWWLYVTEPNNYAAHQPEYWNEKFPEVVDRALDTLRHRAALSMRGPSIAKWLSPPPATVQLPFAPAPAEQEEGISAAVPSASEEVPASEEKDALWWGQQKLANPEKYKTMELDEVKAVLRRSRSTIYKFWNKGKLIRSEKGFYLTDSVKRYLETPRRPRRRKVGK